MIGGRGYLSAPRLISRLIGRLLVKLLPDTGDDKRGDQNNLCGSPHVFSHYGHFRSVRHRRRYAISIANIANIPTAETEASSSENAMNFSTFKNVFCFGFILSPCPAHAYLRAKAAINILALRR